MINSTVIKAFENPLETADFPYDFFNWEKNDKSPWGFGVPYLMRTQQRVLNAGWRQTMDNAGLAVGPQIVIKEGSIEPADQKWELTGRKIWKCTDSTENVGDAFHVVDIPMHINELQTITKMAMEFIDLESAVPEITHGEQGSAPETVGGMTILMNNANVVTRRIVKGWDDDITVNLLTRYYDWNMAYNKKSEIKGDYVIDARGSTALLVRDMQNQALVQLGQYEQNPTISVMVNWDEWFKETLKANHIDTSKILKNDQEIKLALENLAKNQPLPPQVQVAQINQQTKLKAMQLEQQHEQQQHADGTHPSASNSEAQLRIAQVRAESAQTVANTKAQAELMYAQKMQEIERQNAEERRLERQDKMQLEIIRYANEQKVSLEKVRADLAKTSMIQETQRMIHGVETQMKQNENIDARNHEANQSALDREHDMTKHLISNLPDPTTEGEGEPTPTEGAE